MLFQVPKQQSIFPDLPRSKPLMDPDGSMNEYWLSYFDNLTSALQTYYSPEGITIPAKTSAEISQLTATPVSPPTGADVRVSNNNIIYDSTTNEFKGNVNGTWKVFTLT